MEPHPIAFVIWLVFGRKNYFECELASEDDVQPVAKKLVSIFRRTALPFYAKYTSIEDIDRLYNSEPKTPKYFMYLVDFWTRTAYATIAAKLVGNPRYGELVRQYKQGLKESDDSWRAGQYDKLVKLLAKVKPKR